MNGIFIVGSFLWGFYINFTGELEWKTTALDKAGRQGTVSKPLIYAHNDNVHVPVCYCVIRSG